MSTATSRETTRFCIAVYILGALLIDASYQLHMSIGGTGVAPIELASTLFFFALWAPLAPVIVRLAWRFAPRRGRRLRALEVHFFAALAFSFLTLFLHKLVFCPHDCYLPCVTFYQWNAALTRWFALDYFVYGAAVAGIWMLDAVELARQRELHASLVERELASAELRVVSTQANPEGLIGVFGWLSEHVGSDPARAERMITALADFLRLMVRAIGAAELTVADDLDLLRAWLEVESVRSGAPVALETTLDERIRSMPIVSPILQPLVAGAGQVAARVLAITWDGIELVVNGDGRELGRSRIDALQAGAAA